MDYELYIDQILDDENLTSDLEDGPAAQLLRWGTGQVSALTEELDEDEAVGRVNALMALMRQVAQIAGICAGAAADDLAAQLGRLLESRALALGSTGPPTRSQVAQSAAALAALPPDRAVTFLLDWLNVSSG